MSACSDKTTEKVTTSAMTASGEFLFEGPNTLQGEFLVDLEHLTDEVDADKISKVTVESINLSIPGYDASEIMESALVQLVSSDLPLQSLGTLSSMTSDVNQLSVNKALDIMPYLKDESTVLVVDVNLLVDMDELSVDATFELSIDY